VAITIGGCHLPFGHGSRPGMTLGRSSYYGVSVYYSRRTTPEHQVFLEERLGLWGLPGRR